MATEPKHGRFLPSYISAPRPWGPHPRHRMLMTPWMVFFGGLFAYAVPTIIGAFWQMMFFNPPISDNYTPLTESAARGRHVYLSNGCVYCHSGFVRPQDVRVGLYYVYSRVSHPGDYKASDTSPNTFGTARIGPDLEQEAGWHPKDWELAHFYNPRFVDPWSIMPVFRFLSNKDVNDLTEFVETRSGKQGLLREAGQEWAKKLFLVAGNGNGAPGLSFPKGFNGAKLTLGDVARQNQAEAGPPPPKATVDGLPFPDVFSVNMATRGYWAAEDPFPVTTNNLLRGRWVFQSFCIGCHGQGGAAVSYAAKFMAPRPIDFTGFDDAAAGNDTSPGIYYYRILRGWWGSAMEPFGQRLSVDDIWKVVLFLKTIPNGGLSANQVPTPEMYIQWHPTPQLKQYMSKHPGTEAREYLTKSQTGPEVLRATMTGAEDPFMAMAQRILPGMNFQDRIPLNIKGFGVVTLKSAAAQIKTIYQDYVDRAFRDFKARGGIPALPDSLRTSPPPAMERELR